MEADDATSDAVYSGFSAMPSGVLTVSFSAGSAPPISLVASLTQAGGNVQSGRRGARRSRRPRIIATANLAATPAGVT